MPEQTVKIVLEVRLSPEVTAVALDPKGVPHNYVEMQTAPEMLGCSPQDAASKWVEDGRRLGRGEATLARQEKVLRQFLAAAKAGSFGDLTVQAVRDFDICVSDRCKASTRRQYLSIVRQFLAWCVEEGYASEHAALRVTLPRASQGGSRAMSVAELGRLVRVTAEFERHRRRYVDRSRALWYMVAGMTGMRSVEMKKIDWSAIDLEHAELWLRAEVTKESRDAVLPLPQEVVEALAAWKASRAPATDDRVFRFSIAHHTFASDLERAGIAKHDRLGRPLTLHGLRKTYTSMLARADVPQQIAMSLTRHKDVRVFQDVYNDPEKTGRRKHVDNLPRILGLGDAAEADGEGVTQNGSRTDGAPAEIVVPSSIPPRQHEPLDDGPSGGICSGPSSRLQPEDQSQSHMNRIQRYNPTVGLHTSESAQTLVGTGVGVNGSGYTPVNGHAEASPTESLSPHRPVAGHGARSVSDSGGSGGAAPGREAEGVAPSPEQIELEAVRAISAWLSSRAAGRDQ